MRILYLDIDTLRPDHLGCYGYHRNTSPHIDAMAKEAVRFNQCFVTDSPCLPARASLFHGKFGIHTGAINHGGAYADPYKEGLTRGFQTSKDHRKWPEKLQAAGLYTCSVSSFAQRHSSHWATAGFREVHNCGKSGGEQAHEIIDDALDFLDRKGTEDNWFLHFHTWDPHTPYIVPEEFGNPFENDPPPAFMTQERLDKQNETYGTHSAFIPLHRPGAAPTFREVDRIQTMDDYKKWVDGYDVGIRYTDHYIGKLFEKLKALGVYEDTAIVLSSDHGENMGELNIYGDHQTADLITHKVPLLIKWPGVAPGENDALVYQMDMGATTLELLGQEVPKAWDAKSFAEGFKKGNVKGRDELYLSHAAWSCQRAVVWDNHILIKTYMDGLKDLPEVMLFDRKEDPHELNNLADTHPDLVETGLDKIEAWVEKQLALTGQKEDPMMGVIEEGGPFHTRGVLPLYLDYFNTVGREDIAKRMEERYGHQSGYTRTLN